MAKQKETTKEVAAPVTVPTTKHKVIREGYGFKVGQTVNLDATGVTFYKSKNIIK